MNEFEINIMNIRHSSNELPYMVRQIVFLFKFHFLKENSLTVEKDILSENEQNNLKYLIKKNEERNKINHPFNTREQFIPNEINGEKKYFYSPVDKKLYNFNRNVIINRDYKYFSFFYIFKMVNTPFDKLHDFFNYHLVYSFNNDYKELYIKTKSWIKDYNQYTLHPEVKDYGSVVDIKVSLFYGKNKPKDILEFIFDWKTDKNEESNSVKLIDEKFYKIIKDLTSITEIKESFIENLRYINSGQISSKPNFSISDWKGLTVLILFNEFGFLKKIYNGSSELDREKTFKNYIISNFKTMKDKVFNKYLFDDNLRRAKLKEKLNRKDEYSSKHLDFYNKCQKIFLQNI